MSPAGMISCPYGFHSARDLERRVDPAMFKSMTPGEGGSESAVS
jgi:hypothetical protein